jgi:hypothetical protein
MRRLYIACERHGKLTILMVALNALLSLSELGTLKSYSRVSKTHVLGITVSSMLRMSL